MNEAAVFLIISLFMFNIIQVLVYFGERKTWKDNYEIIWNLYRDAISERDKLWKENNVFKEETNGDVSD